LFTRLYSVQVYLSSYGNVSSLLSVQIVYESYLPIQPAKTYFRAMTIQ